MNLKYMDSSRYMKKTSHGRHRKTLIVLHETVSKDVPGWGDITSIVSYLAAKGYGIHGMTDAEGNVAWAYGMGQDVLYHAGGVNEPGIGIENVSDIMLRSPKNSVRRHIWALRTKQLRSLAKLLACISRSHGIPLKYVDGSGLRWGVTSHWSVSKYHKESEGHTDCWPVNDGGYFPMSEVLRMARVYKSLGWRFSAPAN